MQLKYAPPPPPARAPHHLPLMQLTPGAQKPAPHAVEPLATHWLFRHTCPAAQQPAPQTFAWLQHLQGRVEGRGGWGAAWRAQPRRSTRHSIGSGSARRARARARGSHTPFRHVCPGVQQLEPHTSAALGQQPPPGRTVPAGQHCAVTGSHCWPPLQQSAWFCMPHAWALGQHLAGGGGARHAWVCRTGQVPGGGKAGPRPCRRPSRLRAHWPLMHLLPAGQHWLPQTWGRARGGAAGGHASRVPGNACTQRCARLQQRASCVCARLAVGAARAAGAGRAAADADLPARAAHGAALRGDVAALAVEAGLHIGAAQAAAGAPGGAAHA